MTLDDRTHARVRTHGQRWLCAALLLAACESPPVYQAIVPPSSVGGAGAIIPPDAYLAADGEACADDEDCDSEHCSNSICCASGECCVTKADCAPTDEAIAACDDERKCQGTRGEAMCVRFRCRAQDGIEDDTACDAKIEADDCGLYVSAFCNGTVDQDAPTCKEQCAGDADCDQNAHCTAAKCMLDLPVGGDCMLDNECADNHCSNSVCCLTGDCCKTPETCDAAVYSSAATCDDPTMCQGTHGLPACEASQCATAQVEDDSACDRTVMANMCADGNPVLCRGGVEQGPPPPCATGTCGDFFSAPTCNEEAFCWEGDCIPDQPNGEGCTGPESCQSAHCQNNVCCSDGDCCENDSQCPSVKTCGEPSMCQGARQDRTCDVEAGTCVKLGEPAEDDSGCAALPTGLDCGLNFAAPCTDAESQNPPVAPSGCIPCTTTYVCAPGQGEYRLECLACSPSLFPSSIVLPDGSEIATMECTAPTPPSQPVAVGCSPLATTCTGGACSL
jgi:hypothetical protein